VSCMPPRARRSSCSVLGLALVLCGHPWPAQAEDGEPLTVQVNRAIDLAAERLFADQSADGSWGADDKVHPTGRTALSLLALLHAGLPASDERVARGIDYLMKELRRRRSTQEGGAAAYRSTYETGVTLMLLYALGKNPTYVNEMQPLVDFLAREFDEGERLWGYPEGARDLSNSQYALLGLRAAALREVRPKQFRQVWAGALEGILRCHRKDGGFAYKPDQFSTASMTVAGLAMIKLCELELKGFGAAGKDLREARAAVLSGQAWLEQSFTVKYNVHGRSLSALHYLYYLYGLERYASFYALDEIAGRDWYREGAEHLIRIQENNGAWGRTEETCFALLFLKKASLTMPSVREGRSDRPRREDNPRLDHRDDLRDPRPQVPSLREWLVAGPYPGLKMDDDHLLVDHIQERKAAAAPKRRAGRGNWREYSSPEDLVDLEKAGAGDVDSASYAFTWLHSERDQEVVLHLDSDDGIRVFLEGELVFEDHHHDPKHGMRVLLEVPEGRSRLLLKLENVGYFCNFRARLTDREGDPPEGLTASLSRRG